MLFFYAVSTAPSVALLFFLSSLFSFQGANKDTKNVPSKLNNARIEKADLGCYTGLAIL